MDNIALPIAFLLAYLYINDRTSPAQYALLLIIVSVTGLTFVVDTLNTENSYEELLSTAISLRNVKHNHVNSSSLILASGKIDGNALLLDELFSVESNSMLLEREVKERYYATWSCTAQSSSVGSQKFKTCGEYRWKVKSLKYQYSPNVAIDGYKISEKLLEELSYALRAKKHKLTSMNYKKLKSFDPRDPILKNGSILFLNNPNKKEHGDIKVSFYSLHPKKASFLTRLKKDTLQAFDQSILDDDIKHNKRVYAYGIVPISHFLNESTDNKTTYLAIEIIVTLLLLGVICLRYLLDEPQTTKYKADSFKLGDKSRKKRKRRNKRKRK